MKKTNLLKGALSVLAVSVLLASCTQVDSRIDTVDTLETPSVKAVAYPGVNYISWNAVKGAANYKVTRTVDEGVEETLVSSTQNLCITDSLSVNDVDVEYKVYALSKSNPSRAVYVYDSNAGSASVTNIFPPVGKKAIELPRYEKDSGWNFDEGADNSEWKDDFIPTAENIKVQLVDDTINVTAPTKAYLTTKVIGYTGNKQEIFYRDDLNRDLAYFGFYQNKMLSVKSVIKSAGEYKLKATVNAFDERLDNAFYEQSQIALNTTITIPAVEASKPTDNLDVAYIDNEKTTARVVFTPAVSKDGTTFAVGNYKVYRALKDSNELVEVKGLDEKGVKEDSRTNFNTNKTEVIYVVEDKVPSNKVAYDYYVVLNANGRYEAKDKKYTLNAANPTTANIGSISFNNFAAFGDDKLSNDIVVKVTPNSDNSKIVSVAYAYSTINDSSKILDSAYTSLVVVPELAEKEQAFLIENVPENNYVFVKAEFAEIVSTGKVNSVIVNSYWQKCTVNKVDGVSINIGNLTNKNDDLLLNDWIRNTIDVNGGEIVSVKYGVDKDRELAKVKAINGTEVTFKVKDYNNQNSARDYTFDIINAGEVGDYIAIAAEVKAEGKTNCLIVEASWNTVSVSGVLPLSIYVDPNYDDPKANRKEIKVNISKYISEENKNNKPGNYDAVEISYIKTNEYFEITNEEEWSDVTTVKFSDFKKLENKNGTTLEGINYSTTKTLISKPYSDKTTEWVTDYYVIKVVTKYNVKGAKDAEDYRNVAFTYLK